MRALFRAGKAAMTYWILWHYHKEHIQISVCHTECDVLRFIKIANKINMIVDFCYIERGIAA